MANAKVKLYYTSPEYLDTLPIQSGNVIFVPNSNMVCLDIADQRFFYETIKTFEHDVERSKVPFPNEGFYFVEETNQIGRFAKGQGRKLTPDNLRPVIYGESEDAFPSIGEHGTLYYTDEGIYNGKGQLNKYNLIANANRGNGIR